MRIEEGNFYRTRDGRKVGPMRSINQGPWKWTDGVMRWTKLGGWSTVMGLHPLDIVAPWPEGPIVTETVQRIKLGVYGPLEITREAASPETPQEGAWVEHDGDVSKAPPEETMVVAYDRAGTVYQEKADNLAWDHDGTRDDIMRWRYA